MFGMMFMVVVGDEFDGITLGSENRSSSQEFTFDNHGNTRWLYSLRDSDRNLLC